MFGRVTDIDVAMKYVDTRGIAVQAGGHVGLWPRRLAQHFVLVHTFEPSADMYACLELNTVGIRNIMPHRAALGSAPHAAPFSVRRSGRSKFDPEGQEMVEVMMIDDLNLPRCDLIYLDVEGAEILALTGAAETIRKYRPVLVLETLKGKVDDIDAWTRKHQYSLAQRIHNDRIFTP